MADVPHQFTPDLNAALIEAIPLICPTKKDVVAFFRGAGLRGARLAELEQALSNDANSFKKHPATRALLLAANDDHSNDGLRVRREILKRVTEFNNFAHCWPDDQMEAKGAVQIVRDLINEKDAVTKIAQAEQREREARLAKSEQKLEEARRRAEQRASVKSELFALFSQQNAQKRGILFEVLLHKLFTLDDIAVREAFHINGKAGEGTVEQIDGVIELDGFLYLVEAKWWQDKLAPGDLAQHTVRVASRAGMRGLFIVHPGYTAAAISMIRESLQRGVFVLATVEELVILLDSDESVADWLRQKVRAAMIDKIPFAPRVRPN